MMMAKESSYQLTLPVEPDGVEGFLSEPTAAVCDAIQRTNGNFSVLGAAGKMGLHVCMMLRKALDMRGDARTVTAVSRFSKPESREIFEREGVQTVVCDLVEPEQLEALNDCQNVIFMAGAKFGTEGNPGFLKLMNEEVPALVARRFARSKITAFSTGCVYSFQAVTGRGANEISETEPVGEYARSCLGRELAFRRASQEFGTQLTLIRLNYSVEFRYGVPVDIATNILNGTPINLSMGHVNLIWQRDAIAQTLLAHELASTAPFIINITGSETLRVRDLANRLGHLLGRQPLFTGIEAETAWINDASLSHRLFGLPETPVEKILEWVAAWQLNGLNILGKPTGFEKRDGNF